MRILIRHSLTSTFTFTKSNFHSESDHFNFTSHTKTLHIYLVQYICQIHSQINHIALSTIIRTCPRSVKNSTVLINTECLTPSTFWTLILLPEFFWQLIYILVILPKWKNIFITQKVPQFIFYIYRLWNYICTIKRKFQKAENNTNVHTSKTLKYKTSTLRHFCMNIWYFKDVH